MRRAAKRDKAERVIIEALGSIGADVVQRLPVDLLVRFRGKLYLLEVKTPGQSAHTKERTRQRDFCSTWNVPYVRTPREAYAALGLHDTSAIAAAVNAAYPAVMGRIIDFEVVPIRAAEV